MVGVADEGDEVLAADEVFYRVGHFLDVAKSAWIADFGVDEEDVPRFQRQRDVLEEENRIFGQLIPRPENDRAGVVVEKRRIDNSRLSLIHI